MKGGKTMKGLRIAQRNGFVLLLGAIAAAFILSAVIIPSAQANGSTTAERIGFLEKEIARLDASQKQTDKEIASLEKDLAGLKTELKAGIKSLKISLLAISLIFFVLWLGTLIGSLWLRKKLAVLRGKK